MQRLMSFVHRIYIRRLERELADAKLEYRVNTYAVKDLRTLSQRVQSAMQYDFPPTLVADMTASLTKGEAILAREVANICQLKAEIKTEKQKEESKS